MPTIWFEYTKEILKNTNEIRPDIFKYYNLRFGSTKFYTLKLCTGGTWTTVVKKYISWLIHKDGSQSHKWYGLGHMKLRPVGYLF
jgi:hypothetical protein